MSAHRRGGTSDQKRKAARGMLLLELRGLSFPGVIRHCEQSIARLLSAAFASDDVVHSELLAMHQQACRSIRDIACTLHRHGVIPVVSTHINVFFLWHAWRQAMSSAEVLEETDQRKLAMKAFTDMYRGKLVVLVPTVCFLVSIRRDTCSFVAVVELHVGRADSVMRSGIKIRYLLCSANLKEPLLGGRLSRNATHSHAHVLCLCLSLGCIAVSAGLG